jgi:hypothetical protein
MFYAYETGMSGRFVDGEITKRASPPTENGRKPFTKSNGINCKLRDLLDAFSSS